MTTRVQARETMSSVPIRLRCSILTPWTDDFTSTESAAVSPLQQFLFQIATTRTSEMIDFFLSIRALDQLTLVLKALELLKRGVERGTWAWRNSGGTIKINMIALQWPCPFWLRGHPTQYSWPSVYHYHVEKSRSQNRHGCHHARALSWRLSCVTSRLAF